MTTQIAPAHYQDTGGFQGSTSFNDLDSVNKMMKLLGSVLLALDEYDSGNFTLHEAQGFMVLNEGPYYVEGHKNRHRIPVHVDRLTENDIRAIVNRVYEINLKRTETPTPQYALRPGTDGERLLAVGENLWRYDTLAEQAASLHRNISQGHYLVDGNKRFALIMACLFLYINGKFAIFSGPELFEASLQVAQGDDEAMLEVLEGALLFEHNHSL